MSRNQQPARFWHKWSSPAFVQHAKKETHAGTDLNTYPCSIMFGSDLSQINWVENISTKLGGPWHLSSLWFTGCCPVTIDQTNDIRKAWHAFRSLSTMNPTARTATALDPAILGTAWSTPRKKCDMWRWFIISSYLYLSRTPVCGQLRQMVFLWTQSSRK